MLVLSRKSGESVVIDGRIKVKIVRVDGDVVKIGIEAPDNVRVIRAELFGRPGPEHPLAVFLEKRRLEKLRDTTEEGMESTFQDRRSRIDQLRIDQMPAQPAPHLKSDC